ncbi:MAG: septum formation inhibitor Maf [Betaproteobacteria bacterium]|nr:septum formation inhibitor Maf [Betaproteobacteria bacterium]
MIAPSKVIYLASKSPRRRELLRQIGVHFELLLLREKNERLDVDESPLPDELPRDYVMRVVRLKAEAARSAMLDRKLPERLVLTADTTVTLDAAILGKPADAAEAARMLERLSGHTHQVLTAVAVADAQGVREVLSTSFVTFDKLGADDIKRYVDTGEPMDKAGGYAVQGLAAKFISKLSGSYSGVMGLPLCETAKLLRQSGFPL